jgi:hypothetical protein
MAAQERHVEPTQVALRTSEHERNGRPHHHVAVFNGAGNGNTTEAADGHSHRVVELEIMPANGHTHELTAVRAQIPAWGSCPGQAAMAAKRHHRHPCS